MNETSNMRTIFLILNLVAFTFLGKVSKASHIFGGELLYKHVSGLTYELTLTLYGDCSGNSYPNLFTSTPKVMIYNGNSAFSYVHLNLVGTPGLEVTPVCPSEINNTKCNGGTLPGVAQFIFKNTVTLSGPSTSWRFIFDGILDQSNPPSSYAGRSNAITNITQGGGSTTIMELEATLNNVSSPNTSANYTTIPTPFFCINIPQQYNQGAIDAENDDLTFELIPALNANNGSVTYTNPFSYALPLATASGSFTFNTSNGQMAFTPNAVQTSLVVTKVTEKRNGVIVGTSMREMTVVVLNNCNNQSPSGNIASTSLGTITNSNEIRTCGVDTTFQFAINVSDPDNQNISVTVNGIPANASYVITGNGSISPVVTINWNIPANAPLGATSFFITYQDDGCPLSSKQTIAYSIIVEQPIQANVSTENVSCQATNDGQIIINANSTNGNLQYSLNGSPYQINNSFNGLTIGNYTVIIKDPQNCILQQSVTIENSPTPEINITNVKNITCYGKENGQIFCNSNASGISNFYIHPGNQSNSTGYFSNLTAGHYTIELIDNKQCKDTAFATIVEPPILSFGNVNITNLSCNKNNGVIFTQNANFPNATYILSPTLKTNSEGYFDNLHSGMYTLSIKTADDCMVDTLIYVGIDPMTFNITTTHKDLDCIGRGYEGEASVVANAGTPPYSYYWNSSPPQSTSTATNLYYGWYHVSVTDATGCELQDTIYIKPGSCCETMFIPNAFTPNGDGYNDEWRITTSTGMNIEHFFIYNRYGQKVWSSIDQRRGWDGTFYESKAEQGTYFYMLRYRCQTDGKMYTKKGDIILIK